MSFAHIYDALMADIDFEEIYNFIKPFIKDKKTLIDAGCGSGYLTTLFAKDFDVIGLDIDSDMLALAKQKLEQNHLNAKLFEHDLNDEILLDTDVIVALFDVINYFIDPKKVLSHFYQALNETGYLILDVYKEEMLDVYDGYFEEDHEPFLYEWKINREGQKITHHIKVDQKEDQITQYIYPILMYKKMLEDMGFDVLITDGVDERKHYIIAKK